MLSLYSKEGIASSNRGQRRPHRRPTTATSVTSSERSSTPATSPPYEDHPTTRNIDTRRGGGSRGRRGRGRGGGAGRGRGCGAWVAGVSTYSDMIDGSAASIQKPVSSGYEGDREENGCGEDDVIEDDLTPVTANSPPATLNRPTQRPRTCPVTRLAE